MKKFIGHTILILLAEIFLFSPIMTGQNNPYKINDRLYSYYQKCSGVIKKPEVLLMADTLFRMADKKGDVKAQCLALNLKSDHYYFTNHINALLIEKEKVADFARKTPYKQYVFGAWNRVISYYLINREYDSAIQELKKYQDEAIRLDNPYGIGKSYVRMGDVYFQQRMFQLAIQQYKLAVDYYIQTGNEKENYYSYRSIGSSYINLLQYEEAEKYALKCLDHSTTQLTTIQTKLLLFQIAYSKGDFKKAKELQEELMQYRAQGVLKGSSIENYFIMNGHYYAAVGDIGKSLAYSDSISDEDLRLSIRYKAFEQAGDFRSAFIELYKKYRLQDSINRNNNAEIMAAYSVRFNNQKLELERNQLSLQNTEMRLAQMQDREHMILMEKEQTRMELENRDLQLKQQQTAIELQNTEAQKQRLELRHKQEQLQRIEMEKKANQRKIWVLFSILILTSGFSTIYAITRRQHAKHLKAEKEVAEEARRQAEKADKLKSAFLQNLSHEIRTPLNAIIGFNDLLNDADAEFSEEERSELLGHLHTNTNLLLTLVNDVLDLSKLESGNYNISLSNVVLPELCQSTLAGVSHRVAEGVKLELRQPEAEIILNTDAQRLQQILTNLLVNACKYTSQGSITLAYETAGNQIIFSVTDTGTGIDKKKNELIFQRFEKLDSMNPGFGLGLSICRSLTTLLKGKIYLDTAYTGGARFIVELPLRPPV